MHPETIVIKNIEPIWCMDAIIMDVRQKVLYKIPKKKELQEKKYKN